MTLAKLRARTWVAIAIIMALAVTAVMNAPGEWRGAETQAQRVSTIVEVSYGVFGIVGVVAVIMHAAWVRLPIVAWAVLITLTALLAPWAWGGSSPLVALVSGVCGALIATVLAMLVLPSRWNPG